MTNVFITDDNILCSLSSSAKTLKTNNSKRLVFGNLNFNVINNKFEQLKYIIENNIYVLIVSERKLDFSVPSGQFSIDGFAKLFHRDRNKNIGGHSVQRGINPPQKHHPLFLAKPSLKFANCPSLSFWTIPLSILFFYEPPH